MTKQEKLLDVPSETPQVAETEETVAGTEETPPQDKAKIEQPASKEPALSPEGAEVARLLAAAKTDIKARRLTSPVGNNAWDNYQRVLELVPAHPDAIQGMERVIESYMELFGVAVEQQEFDKAGGYLTKIHELHPDSPVLEEGERRLASAKQTRADRLAELERQRIEQAIQEHWVAFEVALEAEELDEAEHILSEVHGLNSEAPGLSEGEQRLVEAQQMALEREFAGEMVSIPGGTFRMGDLSGDGDDDARPVHSVTVPAYRMGKYEVTFVQWDACVADGGCGRYRPDDEGWGRGNRPVINVSWDDAQSFIDWLNNKTGGNFRLPSEAEWEYAARAGSTTKYHFGNSESQLCRYANHADDSTDYSNRNKSCSDGVGERTAVVGRYLPNSYGLYDMHGNVWEWVQDCWNDSYEGAPSDGIAWNSGDCSQRVRRGGSWYNTSQGGSSSNRAFSNRWDNESNASGFRLAQDD